MNIQRGNVLFKTSLTSFIFSAAALFTEGKINPKFTAQRKRNLDCHFRQLFLKILSKLHKFQKVPCLINR